MVRATAELGNLEVLENERGRVQEGEKRDERQPEAVGRGGALLEGRRDGEFDRHREMWWAVRGGWSLGTRLMLRR